MADQEREARETPAIDGLLKELAELRELDRQRQAQTPGSAAHDAATLEVDLRSRRLMDRFRDLKQRRRRPLEAEGIDGARNLDARPYLDDTTGSRLN